MAAARPVRTHRRSLINRIDELFPWTWKAVAMVAGSMMTVRVDVAVRLSLSVVT